ncbi:MAG TPA: hypothetical protein VKE74_26700 [Gemmataceae bacterium]|nr:hypothetical protein [Gemmataceae bacterium]
MQAVYSITVDLDPRPGEPAAGCFSRLAARAMKWVEDEYARERVAVVWGPSGAAFSPTGGDTLTRTHETLDPGHDLFSLDWVRKWDDELRMGLGVELARTPLGLQARVAVRAIPTRPGADVGRADVFRPGVVDALLAEANGLIGGRAVPNRVRAVGQGFIPGLVDELLDPGRALPIVLLTPHPDSNSPIVDPERLLEEVFGLAQVVELSTGEATFALTRRLGKEWSCFWGAVRIYWPGLNPGSDNFRHHPIFFPDQYPPGFEADVELPRDVLRRLAAWANHRFAEAPLVRQARLAREKKQQAAVQARIAELAAGVEQAREWQRHLEDAWDANRRLSDDLALAKLELAEVREELARQQQQWATVSREIAAARDEAGIWRAAAERFRVRVLDKLRRVAEAVELARADFPGTLEFLATAADSADESPYHAPRRVYELFATLDEAMREIRAHHGHLGEPMYDFLRRRGFEYKDRISQTSEGRFGGEYTFTYRGRKVLFENHVTLGASHNPQDCMSVHWLRDDDTRRFVIGWCGKHRTNTRT